MNGSTQSTDKLHVLVIGAGVTGLLVAHGLKKAGIDFTVCESEASSLLYRPREWSMGIHWSLPQLESLLPEDLRARLREPQNDPYHEYPAQDHMKIYNGLTGQIMKSLPIPKTIRVSRRKMRAFCAQGINVQYGKELEGLSFGPNGEGVTAMFKDGEKMSGTMVIGCDGPRSKVRELLFGPDKASVTPLEVVHSNVAVRYNDAEKARFVRSAHPSFSIVTHPDCFCFISIQDVPDPEKPETWSFQVVTSWLGQRDSGLDEAGRLAQVKEKASVLSEPFRSANLWMPDDTRVTYDSLGYWVPIPWDNREGRVTLAGDAAHAMTPHRGQGLNHAICDASYLVAAIRKVQSGETELQEAITSYDKEVVPRGADEVIASQQNAMMMLDWNKIMKSPIMTRSLDKGILKNEKGDASTEHGHLTNGKSDPAPTRDGVVKSGNNELQMKTGLKAPQENNADSGDSKVAFTNGIGGIHGIPTAYEPISPGPTTSPMNEHNALKV